MSVPLLLDARSALSLNQRSLAEFLGISSRTVQRWDAGRSQPVDAEWHKLARAVHPIDPELAARLAKAGRSSLDELGLGRAAPPPIDVRHLADGVVCAAAESMDLTPRAVRPAVFAAFRRARQMRLTVEDMESALAPPEPPRKKPRSADSM
jgi:DNA-binding XRE family transcriptional regulator